MDNRTLEYNPGQIIRFEAVCLYHNTRRIAGILGRRPGLVEIDARALESIKMSPSGEIRAINRNRQHYDEMLGILEAAQVRVGQTEASGDARDLWMILNKCHYHCTNIISMMEKYAPETASR